MTIIDRILALAKENNISQLAMSKAIGISSGNISDWKNGRSAPKMDAINKLADYFNVSTDYLLGRTEQKTAVPSEDETAALLQEPYMKEIYETLLMLTPESRKLVLAQIRAVGDFESSAKKEASPPWKDPPRTS